MLKMLVAIALVWLALGAVGALMIDRRHAMTMRDVALGPITLGYQLIG